MSPAVLSSFTPLVATNSVAPRRMASSLLESVLEKTVTAQPILAANWIARCPSPPIPMTPIRWVGLTAKEWRTLKTVAPPHWSGAANSRGMESGILKTKFAFQMAWVANEPWSRSEAPYISRPGQRIS